MYLSHPFRKKWGQNFLRDPNTINKIVSLLGSQKTDTIIEIGPGDGALTDVLSRAADKVHVIEIDPLLVKHLKKKKYKNVIIHQGDILDWKISALSYKTKIIGNLPYNISSPILFHLLKKMNWERLLLMFQKELAERIISKNGTKLYGRISVMCQVYCNIKYELSISKNVFQPKPDVDSTVLSFLPKDNDIKDHEDFSQFIKNSFLHRRKKLKNNLQNIYKEGILSEYSNIRPEQISPKEFIELYKRIILVKGKYIY